MRQSTIKNLVYALLLPCLMSCFAIKQPAHAGDGFPPFGAWAYGTRGPSFHGASGFGYAGYRRPYHHGLHSRYYSNYRWTAPSYALSVHYPTIGCYYPRYRYTSYSTGYSVVRYLSGNWCTPAYSSFYFSSGYTPLVYPSFYPFPASCAVSGVYPISSDPLGWSVDAFGSLDPMSGLQAHTVTSYSPTISMESTSDLASPAHYVVQGQAIADEHVTLRPVVVARPVPTALLEAADRILAAGGYREAAIAYAQLTERFGSNNQLLGRRFIAQALSEDFDQAAAISGSARLTDAKLSAAELPGGSVDGLGVDGDAINRIAEQLAEFAVSQPDQPEPLASVAYWLSLSGHDERASLFFRRVEQLENALHIAEESEIAGSKTTFVTVE